MANYTENFNLIKPEDDEYYDVADFNANMDTIDEALTENAGASEILQGIISADGQGVRVVRSIQRVNVYSETIRQGTNSGTASYPIEPVNPSRCLVIMQRLYQELQSLSEYSATLTETALNVTYTHRLSVASRVEFWIIEFY